MKKRRYLILPGMAGLVTALLFPAISGPGNRAWAQPGADRPDAPILRSEIMNRAANRNSHLQRLYRKLDRDLLTSRLEPLFFDDPPLAEVPDSTLLMLGLNDEATQETRTFGGRNALASIARKLDFDSANGTFPHQSRTRRTPLSVWLRGNQTSIENHTTFGGYDPGLSGDVISIDTGVDYQVDDSLIVGMGVGIGNTRSEMGARSVLYRENNMSFSPYFVNRLAEWINLRGSIGFGNSAITQSALNDTPFNPEYAENLSSRTVSATLGFSSDYALAGSALSLRLSGDLMSAREYFADAKAENGTPVAGHTAFSQLATSTTEIRYTIAQGEYRIVPYTGQDRTITLMNQGYGRIEDQRYYIGSEYSYAPWLLSGMFEGFHEFAGDGTINDGMRAQLGFQLELPEKYGVLHPYMNGESNHDYLELGGGLVHRWRSLPGQIDLSAHNRIAYADDTQTSFGQITFRLNF